MIYSFWLAAMVLLYASPHIQDSTYHSICYTSCGTLAGTRNSSMLSTMKDRSDDPSHHERSLLPWRIDPTTHHTMSERCYHGATSRSVVTGNGVYYRHVLISQPSVERCWLLILHSRQQCKLTFSVSQETVKLNPSLCFKSVSENWFTGLFQFGLHEMTLCVTECNNVSIHSFIAIFVHLFVHLFI